MCAFVNGRCSSSTTSRTRSASATRRTRRTISTRSSISCRARTCGAPRARMRTRRSPTRSSTSSASSATTRWSCRPRRRCSNVSAPPAASSSPSTGSPPRSFRASRRVKSSSHACKRAGRTTCSGGRYRRARCCPVSMRMRITSPRGASVTPSWHVAGADDGWDDARRTLSRGATLLKSGLKPTSRFQARAPFARVPASRASRAIKSHDSAAIAGARARPPRRVHLRGRPDRRRRGQGGGARLPVMHVHVDAVERPLCPRHRRLTRSRRDREPDRHVGAIIRAHDNSDATTLNL